MHDLQLAYLTIILIFLLLAGRVAGSIAVKCQQPAMVGEILMGIILGPTLIGHFFPEFTSFIFPKTGQVATVISILLPIFEMLILFGVGMEIDLKVIQKNFKNTQVISSSIIIFPFIIGFSLIYFFPQLLNLHTVHDPILSSFIGISLSLTALPVVARILQELNLLNTTLSNLIFSSAMVSDLFAWLTIPILLSLHNHHHIADSLIISLVIGAVYVVLLILYGGKLVDKILGFRKNHTNYADFSTYLLLACISGLITIICGIHALLGAFIMGIAINNSQTLNLSAKKAIHSLIYYTIFPFYFISTGLKFDFITNFNLVLFLGLLVLAVITKYFVIKFTKPWIININSTELNLIAWGLVARGAIEIMLATVALQAGIIDLQIFVALVLVAIVSSNLASIMMKRTLK